MGYLHENIQQRTHMARDILHPLAFVDNQNIPFRLVPKAAGMMGKQTRKEDAKNTSPA